jgi:hypothetical protein
MMQKSTSAAYLIPSAAYPDADAVNIFTDDTEQFAELNGVKAQSVRKRYAQTGSYFGIRPVRLASRRLKWPHIFATKSAVMISAHLNANGGK